MSESKINPTKFRPDKFRPLPPIFGAAFEREEPRLGMDCCAVHYSRSRRRVFASPSDGRRTESKEHSVFTASSDGDHGDRPERRYQ
jgi:hypothetical protein